MLWLLNGLIFGCPVNFVWRHSGVVVSTLAFQFEDRRVKCLLHCHCILSDKKFSYLYPGLQFINRNLQHNAGETL